jgi:glycosyltransferase involved in cell wall biosynthesis
MAFGPPPSRSAQLVGALVRDRNTTTLKGLRVAIVHDWLVGGGAELVVEQLHKLFPDAPIYTSYATREWRERLDDKVVTGWLQWWPLSKLRKFIPFLRIIWFTNLQFKNYDLVISSSGAEAKGIKVPKDTIHVNYCHAPTHYYWSRYDEYMKRPGFGAFDPLARLGLRLLVGPLRRWDKKAAKRPDFMVANSTHIQQEIKKYYGRKSLVIHPPVYFERFAKPQKSPRARHGYVVSGRQTPYKRFDIAVLACNRLQLPLTVIGDGPDNKRLRALAGPTITFLGRVSDEVLQEEFSNAAALIFPGLDDFGITPVEAMAAGTPVIAYKAGGALDYVKPGATGAFFARQSADSLEKALQQFEAASYNKAILQGQARQFSSQVFRTKFSELVLKLVR